MRTQTYKQFLESLLEAGTIKDFKENHTDVKVLFTISMDPNVLNDIIKAPGGIVKKFKLESSLSTSNMHLFDRNVHIKKYESPKEILEEFYRRKATKKYRPNRRREANEEDGNDGDSEDEDDMSNDGLTSPSAMDSEMRSGDGVDESDSRHQKSASECASPTEPPDVMNEMEKESRLYRILLCQHGLRAAATLLKSDYCALTFIRGVGYSGLKDLLTVAISETPTIAGVGDIASLEESWLMLWSRRYAIRSAHAAPSTPVM
ncbi:hypothetical protein PsorP6_015892 [Peronosclerospora sorghi]|uniref:Uncharacterized protein n=1 Tax=Peronosclerospora sorghi TaxID=230839 RepID=A0ACC0WM29_9STRA|nr:hypothetical protein PsorP6_015892 [Peronosclerospora sorghi]